MKPAEKYLSGEGVQCCVVGKVDREPYTEDIPPLVKVLRDYEPDVLIGLGGGSVLDAAKAAWLFYECPDLTWDSVLRSEGVPDLEHCSRLVAVPTTSGSGSEVSRVTVLIDPDTRLKRLIMSTQIVPALAIVDHALTVTMPPRVTAQTGLDALTHAIEATVASEASEFSIAMALRAVRLIFDALPGAYRDGRRADRETMHIAATMASLAASNSTTGIVHGMDQVGPLLGLPHGLVCAILLPYTLAFNLASAEDTYAEMGTTIGVRADDTYEQARGFLQQLVALERRLDLPASFRAAGVDEDEYFGHMPAMVEAALTSQAAQHSPRVPTSAEATSIFERAYWGELPQWIRS